MRGAGHGTTAREPRTRSPRRRATCAASAICCASPSAGSTGRPDLRPRQRQRLRRGRDLYLILHTLHLPLDRLEPFLDAVLLPDEVRTVLAVLERRVAERVPAAYLTREAWLGDYRFYVDERVIVPRSHIAELLDEGFSAWLPEPEAVTDALDLCTGSGCLAILLADAFPKARVDAVDLSADALEVARRNVADYALEPRVTLIRSDLFDGLQGRRYELIVSNPPYVDADAMHALPAEYPREPAWRWPAATTAWTWCAASWRRRAAT